MAREQAEEFVTARPRVFAPSDLDQRVFDALARCGASPPAIARHVGEPTERIRGSLERLIKDARVEQFYVGKRRVFRIADSAGPF